MELHLPAETQHLPLTGALTGAKLRGAGLAKLVMFLHASSHHAVAC
jgi:hypothetical protein